MPTRLRAAIDRLSKYGIAIPAAQIFVTGPQSYQETLNAADKVAIKKIVDDTELNLVIHGAYVDNPWNRRAAGINNIVKELRIATEIGASGVIVHLGNKAHDPATLRFVLTEIAAHNPNATLWLETHTAKQSPFTYETPGKIRAMFDKITEMDLDMTIGLCVDTAHVFSCGVALDNYVVTRSWFDDLPDVPTMLHLNDSASTLGSGKDKHAGLCQGHIWSQYHPDTGSLPWGESGLAAIFDIAIERDMVCILERHEDSKDKNETSVSDDLALIAAKWPRA